jgi:hypothetical protein
MVVLRKALVNINGDLDQQCTMHNQVQNSVMLYNERIVLFIAAIVFFFISN